MRHIAVSCVVGLSICGCMMLAGCEAPGPKLSQAQMNALETREVEASFDDTYRAASNALFDAGYTIAMSDKSAGLLTGSRAKDRSAERMWGDQSIRDTVFLVSMQITNVGPKNSSVRVKTSINGEARVDPQAINQLWVLMQRQVMMKEPLPVIETPAAK
jgi:hypothetical protein